MSVEPGDIHFPDHHAAEEAAPADDRGPAWARDHIVLTTVGIDIGSTTSHLMFSRVHLARLSQSLSSRFVVVERQVLHRSPIALTPFRDDGRIDTDALAAFVDRAYVEARLEPRAVDTGAVVLTGAALERTNSRAVAELFAREGGRFVCAAAGHHMEALLAAYGSGAVARSRDEVVLNIDVGGGTTKLALCADGDILATTALAVGARLVAFDEAGRVALLHPAARDLGRQLGIRVELGGTLESRARAALALAMADLIVRASWGKELRGEDSRFALVPEPLPTDPQPQALTFSGGVAEFVHGRAQGSFGDLGAELADALRRRREHFPAPIVEAPEGIRATVIGASQFTVQVSGNTIYLPDPALLPLRDLPVVAVRIPRLTAGDVRDAVRGAMAKLDLADGEGPLAIALDWRGEPRHENLRALAEGVRDAVGRRRPLVVAFDSDVGRTFGAILADELGVDGGVVVVDGLELRDLDYVDLGTLAEPAHVVPVVIKSLLFGPA